MAWTGDRLLVWGGYVFTGYGDEQPQGDGFSFDARSRTWGPLPPAPLAARVAPATAWTGKEMVIWGGRDRTGTGSPLGDGAAYDPSAGAWRMLPPAPLSGRVPYSVWAGRELLVWGSSIRDQRLRDGAAYDPVSDSWRRIAEAPVELTDATAVWTGREMIVFGAALHGGNIAETERAIGAAYDPKSDTWRRLPDSELSPQASTAAWTRGEMVAWDYEHAAAAYDPAQDRWRRLDGVPLDPMECGPEAVAVGDHVVGDFCGMTALYDPARDRWRDISDPELLGWGFDLVSAYPVALLVGRNHESGEEALLAYRPTS